MKTRLDAELVRRGLVRSREAGVALIESGQILVNGLVASKPATQVDVNISITLKAAVDEFVSRGGHKLAGALDTFKQVIITGKVCLDAGASTGGFTDVLLKRGAALVIAADVGYGQLAWQLQNDERVKILDRVNVRNLSLEQVGMKVDLVVADLSFISLRMVLPALISVAKDEADFLIMVKPQFEVGREKLGSGGVVRDVTLRKDAVMTVASAAYALGYGTCGVVASPLPGPSGNVEYFLWLSKGAPALIEVDLDLAIKKGPA